MPVSAEGEVKHQNRNQTATSQWPIGSVFVVQLDYLCRLKSVSSDGVNRVAHRKTLAGSLVVPFSSSYNVETLPDLRVSPSDGTLFNRHE